MFKSIRRFVIALTTAQVLSGTVTAHAVTVFPYSQRTKPYTGWNSGVRGDDTIVGMSDATVALPFNIGASELNPAGFAMLQGSVNAQVSGTEISDRQIQPDGTKIKSNYYGLAINPPPWGFAVTSYSPAFESGTFRSPVSGHDVDSEVSVRELRFSVSRMFLHDTAAVGVSLDLAKANREIGGANENQVSAGFKIGGLYKLKDHLTLGLTLSPQNTIKGNPTSANQQGEMPGFAQPIILPTIAGAGVGWTPNRFFQVGASVLYVARTSDTALLADQSVAVGQYATLQPRLGATYTFFQFTHFKGDLAAGSYYEVSRVEGDSNRLHATASMDVNIYMFNTGVGLDRATGYRNVMVGVGIDIIRTLRALDIVPKDNLPPYDGFFPTPHEISADGLSEGLSHGEPKSVPNQSLGDVKQIIEAAPGKISDKIQGKPVSDEPSPTPSKKPKKRRHPKTKASPRPADPAEKAPN
jgi:hypothetical protein